MQIEFEFEELSIRLLGQNAEGVMLYGTATLEGDAPDNWWVTEIDLGGVTLTGKDSTYMVGNVPCSATFEIELFKRIARVIEDERTTIGSVANARWIEAWEDENSAEAVAASRADAQRDLERDEVV